MKTRHLLLLVIIVAFSSCSSAFRTGQTPDDVYYSPAPPPPVEYVITENQQDRDSYAYNNNTYNSEDFAIRRGISDPRYRSNISLNFGYGYNPYDYYGSSFYSPYSSYYNPYAHTGITFYPNNYNYNSYYSPFNDYYYSPFSNYYYPSLYIASPVSNSKGPRTFNLGAYSNNISNSANRVYSHPGQSITNNSAPVRTFTPQSQNRSGVGNFIRRVFTPSNDARTYSNDNARSYRNDNSSNNSSSPVRTIQTNTSGSSSSSSSSGSSSAPVRTFRK